MTKNDYDNIAKCIRKKGTCGQRKALKGLMTSAGWDQTHGNKIEIKILRKKIAELEEKAHLLRCENRRLIRQQP